MSLGRGFPGVLPGIPVLLRGLLDQVVAHLVYPHIPASPAMGGTLLPGQRLNAGDSLTSGSMRLVVQINGHLVVF